MQRSDRAFSAVAEAFHKVSGIRLEASKRQMVIGRLQRLAGERGFDHLDDHVERVVVGTDLSTAVVGAAQRALYPMDRAKDTPLAHLKRFCLKGQGSYQGKLLIDKALRKHVHFLQANLTQALPDIGMFDVVFLRNVLICFDPPAKLDIVQRVLPLIQRGGYLFTGHSESLSQIPSGLAHQQPAVYARN